HLQVDAFVKAGVQYAAVRPGPGRVTRRVASQEVVVIRFVLSERPGFGRPCTRPVHADIMSFDEVPERTAARRLVVSAVRTFMQLLKPLLIKKVVVKSAGIQVHIASW